MMRFSLFIVVKLPIGNKDYSLLLNRSMGLVRFEGVQMFRGYLYWNHLEESDILAMSKEYMSLPIYYSQMEEEKRYSAESWEKVQPSYFVNKILLEKMTMMKMLGMTSYQSETYMPSYFTTKWERKVLKDEILKWDKSETVFENSFQMEVRKAYLQYLTARKGKYVTKERRMPDVSSVIEIVSTLSLLGRVTHSEVQTYLMNRHDIFASLFMNANKLEIQGTDEELQNYFYEELKDVYPAALKKSPDYIRRNDDGTYLILEFSVTNGDVTSRIQDKVDKYMIYFDFLNNARNFQIDYRVVVLDMTDSQVRIWPEEKSKLMTLPNIRILKDMEMKMSKISNYTRIRMELEGDVKIYEADVQRTLDKLTKLLVSKDFSMIKSASMEGAHNMNQDLEMTTIHEDPVLTELTSRTAEMKTEDFANLMAEQYRSNKPMFGPEVMKIIDASDPKNKKNLTEKIKKAFGVERKRREATTETFQKVFKMPILTAEMGGASFNIPGKMSDVRELDDGTFLYRMRTNLVREERKWTKQESKEGMGLDESDVILVEQILSWMKQDVVGLTSVTQVLEAFKRSKLFKMLSLWEDLSREIMLMSERRFIYTNKAAFFSYKIFENFSLEVHKGSKLTSGKQLRFRVHVNCNNEADIPVWTSVFHSFKKRDDYCWTTEYMTTWLTASKADLEHFVTIKSRAMVLLSEMIFKTQENSEMLKSVENSMVSDRMIPDLFLVPILIMMEHKRNTSTSAQAARYVMHSMTSMISDKKGVLSEILSLPIRTLVQSFVVQRQMQWMSRMAMKKDVSSNYLKNMLSDSHQFDQVLLPSIYDPKVTVEFNITMFEIYYSNIFNQNLGMKSHREKAIVEKMAKEEKNYSKVKDGLSAKIPFSKFMEMKDTHHVYCSDYVRAAVKLWKSRPGAATGIQDALLYAETQSLEEIIKMTRSVVSAPTPFRDFLNWSTRVEKKSVLEAAMEVFSTTGETILSEICSKNKEVYAIFSTFSKNQFGGPREILVQAIMTRIHTAYFNSFFKKMCTYSEKEMITAEKKKREIQAATAVKQKDMFVHSASSSETDLHFPITINSDASKWAPSMVMDSLIEMVSELLNNEPSANHFLSVLKAYASKLLFCPASLVKKWAQKPEDILENSEDLEWVRQNMDATTGAIFFFSGMGQGNFQHPSSFFYCLVDDLADDITRQVLERFKIKVSVNVTLISSDDCTKMMVISIPKLVSKAKMERVLLFAMAAVVDIFTTCRKAANIHINWKKTALHCIIAEFNSMFSVGKRVALASIKSVYNSMAIVDMTFPERAVKEVISNIRPMLEEGCSVGTLEVAFMEMRAKLERWYNLESVVAELTDILDCKRTELPYQLGFVPVRNPVEICIYGADYHMLVNQASDQLCKFYKGLYSAPMSQMDEEEYLLNNEDLIGGNFKIKLDVRLSKKMAALKRETIQNEEMLLKAMDRMVLTRKLNTCMPSEAEMYNENYLNNINLLYEHSDAYRVNSMIRAMQLKNKEFSTVPRITTTLMTENEASESTKVFSSLFAFVGEMMSRHEMMSTLGMFDALKPKAAQLVQAKRDMANCSFMTSFNHAKMRKINFFDVTTSANASVEEILSCIFDEKTSAKTRVYKAVREVCHSLSIETSDLMANPFQTIKVRFSDSAKPYTDFKNFLSFYVKLFFKKSLMMLSPFVASGVAVDNILNIYKYKTRPGEEMVFRGQVLTTDFTDKLQDAMLFLDTDQICLEMKNLMSRTKRDPHVEDTREQWCMKVLAKLVKKKETKLEISNDLPISFLAKNRVLFLSKRRQNLEERFFLDTTAAVKIKIVTSNFNTLVEVMVFQYKDAYTNFEISDYFNTLIFSELLKIKMNYSKIIWQMSGYNKDEIMTKWAQKGNLEKPRYTTTEISSPEEISRLMRNAELRQNWTERAKVIIEKKSSHWAVKMSTAATSETSDIPWEARMTICSSKYKLTKNPEYLDEDKKHIINKMIRATATMQEILTFMKSTDMIKNMSIPEIGEEFTDEDWALFQETLLMEAAADELDFSQLVVSTSQAEQMFDLLGGQAVFEEHEEETAEMFSMLASMENLGGMEMTDLLARVAFGTSEDMIASKPVEEITPYYEITAFTSLVYSRFMGAFGKNHIINVAGILAMSQVAKNYSASILMACLRDHINTMENIDMPNMLLVYLTEVIITRSRLSMVMESRKILYSMEINELIKSFNLFISRVDLKNRTRDLLSMFGLEVEEDSESELSWSSENSGFSTDYSLE